MSEESNAGTDLTSANQTPGASQGTSAASLGEPGGQPASEGATPATQSGQGADTTEVVFDPVEFDRLVNELPENLQTQAKALLKQQQAAFTRKTQSIADLRKQAEAYQAFLNDPHGTLQSVARQLGYQLQRPNGGGNGNQADGWTPESGEDPQTWQDVTSFIKNSLQTEIQKLVNPMLNEFKSVKQHTIESQLGEIDPNWRAYEEDMIATLQKHPTLKDDPANLYRLSVPAEVFESRATQRALQKLEARAKAGQMSGASTTVKHPPAKGGTDKSLSFSDAVKLAAQQLAEQGLKP